MKTPIWIFGAMLALVLNGVELLAQKQPDAAKQNPEATSPKAADNAPGRAARREDSCEVIGNCQVQTFYLSNASEAHDANEIQVAIRNILPPTVKVYLDISQSAITIQATP